MSCCSARKSIILYANGIQTHSICGLEAPMALLTRLHYYWQAGKRPLAAVDSLSDSDSDSELGFLESALQLYCTR